MSTRHTPPATDHDDLLVARAIATAPRSTPPVDFAAAVAARAGRRERGFERTLACGLLLVLGAAAAMFAAFAIGPAWQALRLGLGGDTLAWIATAATCVAATWAIGLARQLRVATPQVPAAH